MMAMAKAAEDKQQEKTIAAGQPTKQHKTKQRHKQNKNAIEVVLLRGEIILGMLLTAKMRFGIEYEHNW